MYKEIVAKLIRGMVGEGDYKTDEPMKNHTSFRVGGPADVLVTPRSIEMTAQVYRVCRQNEIPVFVMGNGTNLIVSDKGIRGVVIKLADNLSSSSVEGEIIRAEAGMLVSAVSKLALSHELAGLEFAEGIPGTLGGAVAMNAGAYTGEMKDVVIRTTYIDSEGELGEIEGEGHCFGKRTSFIQKEGGIVVRSQLKLRRGKEAEIKALMDDFNRQLRDKQPLEMPSAGSIFKRPEGHFAGKLIQDCGLRGYGIGGAEVSAKHCGFIVNKGNAVSSDIVRLIKHIQDTVKSRFGVDLQTEVKIIGEE